MKKCAVCTHDKRVEIETALLKMTPESGTLTLERIAEAYDVTIEDLQEHALFHTSFNCEPDGDSIVRQIKMRAADMLSSMAVDQLTTMKAVGKRIRRFVESSDEEDIRFEKMLTKSVVDLYVGCGDGVKSTVKALADINQLLNGPKDDGLSGLAALANVLERSRNNVAPVKEDNAE